MPSLIRPLLLFALPLLCASPLHAGEPLTLRRALALALKDNPALATSAWEVPAAEARAVQAGLRPNPEAQLGVENIGVSGRSSRFGSTDQAETTLQLSQLVELGGKRKARLNAARTEREIALRETEARRVDLLKQTTQAFIDVLALQEQVAIEKESLALSEQLIPAILARVEAGKSSPVETTRSQIAAANARMDLRRSEGELALSRQKLAALLGQQTPSFEQVAGNLEKTPPLPKPAKLAGQLASHPEIAKSQAEIRQREAQLRLEKAKATPDLTAFAGPRWLNEEGGMTLVAGVSLPLPFWNRNQGAIQEARLRIAQARDSRRATQVRLSADLAAARETLLRASREIELLRGTILPGAAQAVAGVDEGYQAGRLSYLDLLEARRTLFSARTQTTRALADYHKAVAEIEALTAAPLAAQ